MKKSMKWIKSWFLQTKDKEIKAEIDTLNTKNIYYVSLIVGIVQCVSLVIFLILNSGKISGSELSGPLVRVGLSVVLCFGGFAISSVLLKSPDTVRYHPQAVRFFIGGFIILLIAWSMFVSVSNYIDHQQLLTFYTVELTAVLFVKLKPAFISTIILGSFILNYLILNYGYGQGGINLYNYLMLALISAAGAILNYQLTVNYISQKNKANELNDSLELIAKHDSTTRLQNRYALNQRIFDYVGRDVCMALGDINSFKAVNDTCGHRVGDDVLKAFSDILLEVFSADCLYRFGGDEFLIAELGDDIDAFRKKLNQVNERFSKVRLKGLTIDLACCFGALKARPRDGSDFFELLTQADKLLYKEKERVNAIR